MPNKNSRGSGLLFIGNLKTNVLYRLAILVLQRKGQDEIFLDIVLPIKCSQISVTHRAEQFLRGRINAIFAILEHGCIPTATDMLH